MNPLLSSVVLGLFAVAPPAGKVKVQFGQETRDVRDRVGLFSASAVRTAQKRIDEIRADFKISLTVETITALPGVSSAALRKMTTKELQQVLLKRAQALADDANVNGLFILIIQEPRHVTVVGWPATRELEISSVKREELRKYLARELSDDPNRALIGTCDLFRDMVVKLQAAPRGPLDLLTALIIVGSVVGLWVLLRFVRSRVVSPALPIYQPAMFGSLFGVPAGYWINDRLFQAEHPTAPPPTVLPPEPAKHDSVHPEPLIEPDPIHVGSEHE